MAAATLTTSPLDFGQLPRRRGRHRLALDIAGQRVPVYWQLGRAIHPCASVTAMVHGDEYEGFVAAQDVWNWARTENLWGSLLVIPMCNPAAGRAATRHTPVGLDGLNLARNFPGSSRGSYTKQLADAIWNLVRHTDALIDLHSGGMGYDYARLAGYYRDADADLGTCFPKALLWPVPPTKGVLSYEFSRLRNKVALGWECGGEGRLDRAGAQAYATGVRRVLGHVGVAKKRGGSFTASSSRIGRTWSQTTSTDGWFLSSTRVGARVQRGETLGELLYPDLRGTTVVSRFSGIIIALRTLPRVTRGDYLALVAEPLKT